MIAPDTYNAENRLVSSASALGTGTYVYDADGKQVRKTVGSTVTDYFYDLAGNVAAERVGSTWTKGYVYAGALLAQYSNSTTYFVHKDHLGSTRLMTGVDRSVCESDDYLPFGEQILGGNCTTHKFTGKERDSESGLDNFGARYDASSLGRFMSPDPVFFQAEMLTDPQRFNQYAYVRDNPLALVDPKGEAIELTCTNGADAAACAAERQKQLQALKDAVGQQAGQYLYENTVTTTDANGNTTTSYYVGVYTNGPSGQGPSFSSINPVSAAFGAIIQDTQVVKASVVPNGTVLRDDRGAAVIIGPLNNNPFVPTVPSAMYRSGGVLNVAILDPSTDPGTLPASVMSNSYPGALDQGILMGHELGHAGYAMGLLIPGPTNKAAVDLENHVRKLKDPNAPIRRRHN